MKKILPFLIAFFIVAPSVLAQQNNTTIEGTVLDSLTRKPESYATVRLMGQNATQPVAVGLTDSLGVFHIPVKTTGRFNLIVASLGRKPYSRNVTVNAGSNKLGELLLSDANVLATATVKAQRPLVKAEVDKLSYSMAEDPDAKTNTLLEMLRKVPMVTVDGEDNIKVNGNSSFKVYVNGKPNEMMSSNPSLIFKSYPANAVKKIEVITNPGAKYDAEGVAGVLNIVTDNHTSMNGYTVTPSLRVDNRGVMGSFFGMAQWGKLTLSANYGIGYNKSPASKYSAEREVYDDAVNHLLESQGANKNKGTFQFGSLDGSYEFSSHDLLSFSAGIHSWNGFNTSDRQTTMFNNAGTQTYAYNLHSHQHSRYPGINASADYQHTFKENQTLTLSYRLNTSPTRDHTINNYSDLQSVTSGLTDLEYNTRNYADEHTGQLDFTTPLWPDHTLSAGLKYIYRNNRSNNDELHRAAGTGESFTSDPAAGLRYRQRGDIAAAYTEYAYKHKAVSTTAGLRYEYYHIHVTYPDGSRDDFKANLGNLVPSVSLGYNLTPTQMLRLGYNLRISRPDIEALSPYVTRATAENASYGNPNLKSSTSNNIELGYSTFSARFSLNTTLAYRFSNDGITSYSFIEDGVQNTTYNNFLHQKSLNLGMYMNWTIVDGTTLNLNGGADYQDLKVDRTGDHNHGFHAYCWGGLTQKLPARMKIELGLFGNTRDIQLQGRGSSFFMYNLNLSRNFLKEDRLQISLRAGNFFGRHRHFRNHIETAQYRNESDMRVDVMRLGLGVTYRLGSLKAQVKKAARTIENSDVESHSQSSSGQSGSGSGQGQSGM